MQILSVESIPVRVPRRDVLGAGFASALGTSTHSDYVVLFVETSAGITGVGEASNIFDREQLMHGHIVKSLAPAVVGCDPFAIAALVDRMDAVLEGGEPAKAAIEMALWDIKGKALGTPVYNLLCGATRPRVGLSFSIPFAPPTAAAAFARDLAGQGFRTLKIKVGRSVDEDVEVIRHVRAAVGPDVRLRADANMAFSDPAAALDLIRRIEPFGLEFLEQPLPRDALDGMAELCRRSTLPIMADESVWTPRDALAAIRRDACDLINVYVSESGGLLNAWRSVALCQAAGMPCIVGSMPELGIGTAANIHLATAITDLPFDCDACGVLYHAEDMLQRPLRIEGGFAYAPAGTGLGVAVDREVIERWRMDDAVIVECRG